MEKWIGTPTLADWHELDKKASDSYLKLAGLFGNSVPSQLPFWLESFLLNSGRYDVRLYELKPSRAQRLRTLTSDRESTIRALETARRSGTIPSVRKLTLKLNQTDAEIDRISKSNGAAKPGPNKSGITPKVLMAARLVEIYLFMNQREPSARNPKLAIALVSLLDTLGVLRKPSGNRLNGVKQAFEAALSVSSKVNDIGLRQNDTLQDEIVLARLHTRRSLKQCMAFERAPWIFSGMNGPVNIYSPKTEI